jgi:hypothetical protein
MTLSAGRKTVSFLLKLTVILSAALGIVLSVRGGRAAFMGGGSAFMFFTIQSNIAIALVCAAGAVLMMSGRKVRNGWFAVKFVFTVAITLTGLVFCFVLAPTMRTKAWNAQNILTHVAVPAAAVADFFTAGICGELRSRSVLLVTLPPLAYVIYAGIAYIRGWEFLKGVRYPYFFLNWGSPAGAFGFTRELPFMGCAWWILALLLLLLGVGCIYLIILGGLRKRALERQERITE